MAAKAATPVAFNLVHIGNRQTGQLRAYWVNLSPIWIYPQTLVVTPQQVTNQRLEEFMVYSDLWRLGGPQVINLHMDTANAPAGSLPPYFPSSGFDITRDGPARQALLNWAKNNYNWPNVSDQALMYFKVFIGNAVSIATGAPYAIRITLRFPDGSTTKVDYNSVTQSLEVIEVRDSQGNLIYTISDDPVQVNYTSYELPGARNYLDYNRGLGWLNNRGLLIVDARGGIQVKEGTVIVGDVVTVTQ